MKYGSHSEEENTPRIAYLQESQAKDWVAKMLEGLNKLWMFEEDYIKNVTYADHLLEHKLPPRNIQEENIKKNYYDKRNEICKEYRIDVDEHDPDYHDVEFIS